jgi:hypothetical protein
MGIDMQVVGAEGFPVGASAHTPDTLVVLDAGGGLGEPEASCMCPSFPFSFSFLGTMSCFWWNRGLFLPEHASVVGSTQCWKHPMHVTVWWWLGIPAGCNESGPGTCW